MIKIKVCIGSSCHIKGSREIVEQLQYLIAKHGVGDKVELSGTFCMERCQNGVCATANNQLFSLTPENVNEFFETNVLKKL